MNTSHPFDWVIGLDRSDAHADLYLINTHTSESSRKVIKTSPESLHEWLASFRKENPRCRVAICLEQPATNLILFLEAYSWITLFPVNPVVVQNFRQTFITSRAKDDSKDAEYAARLLLIHHEELSPWLPEDPQTRKLQQLTYHRRAIVDERTQLTNCLQGLLKQYFPQALELCGDELWRPLATAFLLKWPSLQRVQKARPETVTQFYFANGSRSATAIQKRLDLIANGIPLTDDLHLYEPLMHRVKLICQQLQILTKSLKSMDQQIADCFKNHPDHRIFRSLLGAGPVLAPRLLATLGAERNRFNKASDLQSFTGIAPVTKQSGGKCHVHRRYICPKFSRQTFHEYAKESVLWCRWASAFYYQQRKKGCSFHTAVRALAYKWQRIIFRCWMSRQPYSDSIYEASLVKTKSPLVPLLEKITLGKSPMNTLK